MGINALSDFKAGLDADTFRSKVDLNNEDLTYHCSNCGESIDRDVNAAINLKAIAVGQAEM